VSGEVPAEQPPSLVDMVGDYLDRYKHYPPEAMTWHEFTSLVDRTGRYEARERVFRADAFQLAQPANDGAELAMKSMHKAALERLAGIGRPSFPRGVA
jgi:hypothetical protein